MKNIKSLLLLVILTSFGIISCQKDIAFVEGSGPGGTKPTTYTTKMSAKVDGVLVECDMAYAQSFTNPNGKKDIQINGLKTPQAFTLSFQDFRGIGTYNAADLISSGIYIAGVADPFEDSYYAENGTIKITTYNSKVIIGTFEFKAINTNGKVKNISEGQFVISLEPISAPTPETTTSNLTAKVDGTTLNFTGQGAYVKSTAIGNIMTIVGINGTKSITVSIYNYKGVGSYEIDIDAQGAYNEDQSQTGSYATQSSVKTGKLIITSDAANTIKGTFEFTAPNTDASLTTKKTVTEGKFDVAYTTTTI